MKLKLENMISNGFLLKASINHLFVKKGMLAIFNCTNQQLGRTLVYGKKILRLLTVRIWILHFLE